MQAGRKKRTCTGKIVQVHFCIMPSCSALRRSRGGCFLLVLFESFVCAGFQQSGIFRRQFYSVVFDIERRLLEDETVPDASLEKFSASVEVTCITTQFRSSGFAVLFPAPSDIEGAGLIDSRTLVFLGFSNEFFVHGLEFDGLSFAGKLNSKSCRNDSETVFC